MTYVRRRRRNAVSHISDGTGTVQPLCGRYIGSTDKVLAQEPGFSQVCKVCLKKKEAQA